MIPVELGLPQQARYISLATALARGARVSRQWPDLRAIRAALGAMDPAVHHGAYPTLQVAPDTGLPTWREWQRVATDHGMAAEALAQLGDADALEAKAEGAAPGSVRHRRWARHRYLTALTHLGALPRDRIEAQLRRIGDGEVSIALQMDKFDAGGLFVRLSVELTEAPTDDDEALIRRDGEEVHVSNALESLLYRASGLTAETTHLLLSAQPGLHVDRVVRGVVGPLTCDLGAAARTSTALEGALELSLDMTAFDLSAARHNDPDRVDETVGDDRRDARRRLGYRVFTDRRFVATSAAAVEIRARCAAAGTRNTIRIIRR